MLVKKNWPVSNLSVSNLFQVVTQQLQRILNEVDYADPFQSGFRSGYRIKMDGGRNSLSILALLDFSATFNTFKPGSFLDWLQGLDVGSTVLCWFFSFETSSSRWWGVGRVPHLARFAGCLSAFSTFNMYMKPLDKLIHQHTMRYHSGYRYSAFSLSANFPF